MALLMSQPPDVPLEQKSQAAAESTQAPGDEAGKNKLTAAALPAPEAEQPDLQVAGD